MTRDGTGRGIPRASVVSPDAVTEKPDPRPHNFSCLVGAVIPTAAVWLWGVLPAWRVAVVVTAVALTALTVVLGERYRHSRGR